MTLRYHEIAEQTHRILNPFTPEKLDLLGRICRLRRGWGQLDLACGKGEMLCQWSAEYGITGTGVDLSGVFLEAARARCVELGVSDKITFVESDAAAFVEGNRERFDVVSCIGATWIGKGLLGTIEQMKSAARGRDSLLLVGEPFWLEPPPPEAHRLMADAEDTFTSLEGTLDRFGSAGLDLIEMVLANHDEWDRYEASQWIAGRNWIGEHPDDPDAAPLREWLDKNRRSYLTYGRRYFGWGVFVLREKAA